MSPTASRMEGRITEVAEPKADGGLHFTFIDAMLCQAVGVQRLQ